MTAAEFEARDRLAGRLGIRLTRFEPGHAVTEMDIRPEHHHNGMGMLHGGVIFTLADVAFAAAANAAEYNAVGVSCQISYLRAARAGRVVATARVRGESRRLGHYEVEVRDEQGELLAVFQGAAYRTSAGRADQAPRS